MKINKAVIYLPIRSFGDFIISAAVVKGKFIERIPIILPTYLVELYSAIGGDDFFKVIGTINYDNQPAFFEFYTVKNFQNLRRLIRDLLTIFTFLKGNSKYIVDYSSRRLFFTKSKLFWPDKNDNIYAGKYEIFAANFLFDSNTTKRNSSIKFGKISKILIIPDSRIKEKSIDTLLIDTITQHFNILDVKVAHFRKINPNNFHEVSYNNFNELIQLIENHDFVISAESLPYHLANFLKKPHFVIYNKSRHFKNSFMTPFMINNSSFSTFSKDSENIVIRNLDAVMNNRQKNI